jgi:hypothetical protein
MKYAERDDLLRQLIKEKELECFIEGKLLKEHFHRTYESLKPVNILKRTIKEIFTAPDIKTNIVNTALGILTGFVAKKTFTGQSRNPLTKLAGTILEILVARKVTKNADEIKHVGKVILKTIVDTQSSKKI